MIGAPVRRASVAAPPGSVVRSPKNSTSGPSPARSRSLTRQTMWLSRSARITVVPASGPRGTTVMPRLERRSTNQSNSSGGSIRSTTTVIGCPRSAIHRPAHSQPPRCGRATITPLPCVEAADDVVLVADLVEAGRDGTPAEVGEPEALQPVAGVGVERLLHAPAQPQSAERGVDAPEVTLDHRPSLRAGHVGAERQRCGHAGGDEPGHRPRPTARRAGTTRW